MQISRILTAFVMTAAAACAHAQVAPGPYVGGNIGSSDWNHGVGGVDSNGGGVTGKVYGGYNFTPNFAIEAGVARLGHAHDATNRIGANAVFVDGVATYPVADKFSVLGRVGLAEANFNGSMGHDTGTGLKLGAGVQYDISKTLAVRAEYEQYRMNSVYGSHANIGQFGVGLKASF